MLNELYTLHRSLKRFNVGLEDTHRWVKRLGRANLLVCGVDASGQAASFELVDKRAATELFQIQKDFHSSFPKTNWDAPIWLLNQASPEVRAWLECPEERVSQRVGLLRRACAGAEISKGQKRAFARMQEYCGELIPRFVEAEVEFDGFRVLMERLVSVRAPEEWIRKLSDAALAGAEASGAEVLAAVETLLAGKFDGKKEKAPILFDLADCTKFRCRVASPRMGEYFNRWLNATEVGGAEAGRCALTGFEMPLETDKTPNPRLPVLGDTVLMSMNPDTRCQARYGRIGMAVFPLGKKTASDLNTALVHLTAADREGKSWKRIPGTTKKKFNLLIAYLESAPHLDARVAEMSRPVRARGLKRKPANVIKVCVVVAPRAGAWIETETAALPCRAVQVAPRAGAWIETTRHIVFRFLLTSRPVRARGLKPGYAPGNPAARTSRPVRARGLKRLLMPLHLRRRCRAPCGRVD